MIAGIVYKCMVCYTEDDGDTSAQVAELRKTMFKNSKATTERRRSMAHETESTEPGRSKFPPVGHG